MNAITTFLLLLISDNIVSAQQLSWIHVNQLGYLPKGKKVLVCVFKGQNTFNSYVVLDDKTDKVIWKDKVNKTLVKIFLAWPHKENL